MNVKIRRKIGEVADLCAKRRVRRLVLFGSAAGDAFDPASSDADLLVEFQPMPPVQRAECYFGLMEDLQGLLGMPVDLVEPAAIRNPYFQRAIEETQVVVYDTA